MRRIPQFTRQLHGLDSVSYWAARREMIRWLYVQDCVFLIRNQESTFCLVSDATSVTENSSALHITGATATTACYSLACRLTQSHQAQPNNLALLDTELPGRWFYMLEPWRSLYAFPAPVTTHCAWSHLRSQTGSLGHWFCFA